MEIFTARQPIFNTKMETVAYEILFRSSYENAMPDIDGDLASSHVLTNTYFNFGLEELTGGKKAFINFTENLILRQIPLIFPKESIIVEILENVPPTKELIRECILLKKDGYKIALDDFIYRPALAPLVDLADIIKLDFRATPLDEIEKYSKKFLKEKKTLLAEKVETEEEYKIARKMGFELFQGFFFCKPQIIKGQNIPSNKVQLLHLIAEINKKDAQMSRIANLIQHDVGLSYKILRYINSAYYRRLQKISSIKDAAVLIGLEELKKLASLVVLTNMESKQQNALLRNSSVRAKFCELVGVEINNPRFSPTALFTMGLFSQIDALLGYPMKKILTELPLSDEITLAYLEKRGPLYPVLVLVSLYEQAQFDQVCELQKKLKLREERLPEIYLEACKWTDESFKSLG
ncbi:MAG: HDOD domain-containing protein [Desulfobacteraceae bacterium]|nr:HDOD domain-containing protein [Desulfobacteraceae bacterium]